MSKEDMGNCPLCLEPMDITDRQMKPCSCGYEICVWCWNRMIQTAEKDGKEGLCPACRTPYDKKSILGRTISPQRLATLNSEKKSSVHKTKLKTEDKLATIKQRKDLENYRVIRRNLAYVAGVPLKLADEKTLRKKEFFGQYGKIVRIVIVNEFDACKRYPNSRTVYITFSNEEETCTCISIVNGYLLDGCPLRASFGTTKFCPTWISNLYCQNPNCYFVHGNCLEEDIIPKDEAPSACLRRLQQIFSIAKTGSWQRSGSILPSPVACSGTRTIGRQGHTDNWRKDFQTGNDWRTDTLVGQSTHRSHTDNWRKDSQTDKDRNSDPLLVSKSRCTTDTYGRPLSSSVAVTMGHVPVANTMVQTSSSHNHARVPSSSSVNEYKIQTTMMKENSTVSSLRASEPSGDNVDLTAARTIISPGSTLYSSRDDRLFQQTVKSVASSTSRVLDSSNNRHSWSLDNMSGAFSSAVGNHNSSLQAKSDSPMMGSASSPQVCSLASDWRNKPSCLTSNGTSNSSENSDASAFLNNQCFQTKSAANTCYTTQYGSRPCDYDIHIESSLRHEQLKIHNESFSCIDEEIDLKHLQYQSNKPVERDKVVLQDSADKQFANQIFEKNSLIYSVISHIFSLDDGEIDHLMDCGLGKLSDDSNTSESPEEYKPWMSCNGRPRFSFARKNCSQSFSNKSLSLDSDVSNVMKSSSQLDNMGSIPFDSGTLHSGLPAYGRDGYDVPNINGVSPASMVVSEPVSSFGPYKSGISSSSNVEKWALSYNEPLVCHGKENQTTKFSQVKERSQLLLPDILKNLIPGSDYGSLRTLKES